MSQPGNSSMRPAITLKRAARGGRETFSAWQLLVIACLLLLARVAGLTRQSLWFDEGYTLALANSGSLRSFLHTFGIFTTSEHLQPLYYGVIFVWSRVAGTSDVALRLPSVIFSVLSGFLIFSFARMLVRQAEGMPKWLPQAALAGFCLSSFSYYYAQEARPYALLQLVGFLLIYLWNWERRSIAGSSFSHAFTAACLIATLTSPFGSLLVATLALTDLLLRPRKWFAKWSRPLIVSGSSFMFYLIVGKLLLPTFISHDVVSMKQSLWMNVAYALFGLIFGTTLGPSTILLHGSNKLSMISGYWMILLASIASVAVMTIGTVRVLRDDDSASVPVRPLAFATALYGAALFVVFGAFGHLNVLPRHASALFSLLFLLGLSCVARALGGVREGRRHVAIGAIGLLLLNAVSMWRYWGDPSYRKDDYRAVADLIRRTDTPSAPPVFLVAGDAELFRHYGASLIDATRVNPNELSQFLVEHAGTRRTVKLVVNQYRNYKWDQAESPGQLLSPFFRCMPEQHLAYMQILECEAQPAMGTQARNTGIASTRTYYAR